MRFMSGTVLRHAVRRDDEIPEIGAIPGLTLSFA
jgi:hypothetical protein